MRVRLHFVLMTSLLFGFSAQAQSGFSIGGQAGLWGSGVWGGAQSCPYGARSGISDDYMEMKEDIADLKAEKQDLKKELREINRDVNAARKEINKGLNAGTAEHVFNHLENPALGPESYANACGEPGQSAETSDSSSSRKHYENDLPHSVVTNVNSSASIIAEGSMTSDKNLFCRGPFWGDDPRTKENKKVEYRRDWWRDAFAQPGGRVSKSICQRPKYQNPGAKQGDINACKRGIDAYGKVYSEKLTIEERMATIDDEIANLKSAMRVEKREASKEAREEGSEGGFCWNCLRRGGKPTTGEILGTVALGALGVGAQYSANRYQTKTNARLGYPGQSYGSSSPWPYAINGALQIGGGLLGGYGCGAMMGGGGLYGAGPYGMMNPYGLGGMGLYGNVGGPFGYPNAWMNPLAMMGGGMYNQGMSPWGVAGPWGNMGGRMNPMMMGGMNPMMSMNPMFQMAMNPMMGGGMMNPMMGGGMMNPMMGGMMNPMMGGMVNPMLGGGQMQMQMMQQYQQQMQQWMQTQQQYQQQQQQRQMMVGQLQQELVRIQAQIQQISMGSYFGSGGFSGAIGGGSTILPLPGSEGSLLSPGGAPAPTVRGR